MEKEEGWIVSGERREVGRSEQEKREGKLWLIGKINKYIKKKRHGLSHWAQLEYVRDRKTYLHSTLPPIKLHLLK